jgi:hypothetical protein
VARTDRDQNVKIWSGRFSAGLGAAVSWRGLMIGGGGSIAKRAAAEVIGAGADAAGAGAGCGRASTGLLGALGSGAIARGARGAIGRGALDAAIAAGAGISPSASPGPRKSLTRVSTSWLIEMWLVSQNAFSRSYVVRLTLMLRRVCFLAMSFSLRYG